MCKCGCNVGDCSCDTGAYAFFRWVQEEFAEWAANLIFWHWR